MSESEDSRSRKNKIDEVSSRTHRSSAQHAHHKSPDLSQTHRSSRSRNLRDSRSNGRNSRSTPMRLNLGDSVTRLKVFFVFIAIIITLLAGRALVIQGINSTATAASAAAGMKISLNQTRVLKAQRGTITDRNGEVLATTQPAVNVIADPYAISVNGYDTDSLTDQDKTDLAQQTPQQIAQILVSYLGGAVGDYLPQLTKVTVGSQQNHYAVLKTQVSSDTYQQMVANLATQKDALGHKGLNGISSEDDPIRYYPSGTLASNVVGFINDDGGASGVEAYEDTALAGVDGFEQYQTGTYGRIPLGSSALKPVQNGTSYQLTIDSGLQYQAQQSLNSQMAKWHAAQGTTIVMNIKTGEVLALATGPSFDSNQPGKADPGNLGNRAVSDAYEPGSVQKVFTMGALLDAGLITPDTHVEVPGELPSGGGVLHDAEPHGTEYMTARGVVYNSSNIGSALLARLMDKGKLQNYLTNFGLGTKTGIQQPAESSGYVPDANMSDGTRDQVAFGQGLSVTAIQMAAGVAAATNGGVYHQPTLIASATDANGKPVSLPSLTSRRVISQQASSQLRNMMESVSEWGSSDAKYSIPGYQVAAKSGTAQMIDTATGAYDTNQYMSSYVTVAPVDDPQILVYTVMQVQGQYGATVASTTSRNLLSLALPRYGVLPEAIVPKYTDPLTYEP